MTVIVWGLGAAWLVARLWLEWRVDRCWLPGTGDVQEYYSDWRVPPPDALTSEGERLWRLRYRVTAWGFSAWALLLVIWFVSL